MGTVDETSQQPVTRRTAVKQALALGAIGLAAVTGDDQALAALSRRSRSGSRSTRDSGRRRDSSRREPRTRRPRVYVRFDHPSSSVVVQGSKFTENARVDITIDVGSPTLESTPPFLVTTATANARASRQGRFTQTVPITSPYGCPFTGKVEVRNLDTGAIITKNVGGNVC